MSSRKCGILISAVSAPNGLHIKIVMLLAKGCHQGAARSGLGAGNGVNDARRKRKGDIALDA